MMRTHEYSILDLGPPGNRTFVGCDMEMSSQISRESAGCKFDQFLPICLSFRISCWTFSAKVRKILGKRVNWSLYTL